MVITQVYLSLIYCVTLYFGSERRLFINAGLSHQSGRTDLLLIIDNAECFAVPDVSLR